MEDSNKATLGELLAAVNHLKGEVRQSELSRSTQLKIYRDLQDIELKIISDGTEETQLEAARRRLG